jgi:hypothetical protein
MGIPHSHDSIHMRSKLPPGGLTHLPCRGLRSYKSCRRGDKGDCESPSYSIISDVITARWALAYFLAGSSPGDILATTMEREWFPSRGPVQPVVNPTS